MRGGRRHAWLLPVVVATLALPLGGASCIDLLLGGAEDAGSSAEPCCVACAEGQVPCGDVCQAADAACESTPGCACAPAADSACATACNVEATCGFRALDACVAGSCSTDGARIATDGDDCLIQAADCAVAAGCACAGGCAQLDACAGSEDPECEATCATLVEQTPVETFQENRCKIESSCGDLALCSQ